MADKHFEQGIKDANSVLEIAAMISQFPIPILNCLTIALANLGIAASFNQYIPELHDAETSEPIDAPLVKACNEAERSVADYEKRFGNS